MLSGRSQLFSGGHVNLFLKAEVNKPGPPKRSEKLTIEGVWGVAKCGCRNFTKRSKKLSWDARMSPGAPRIHKPSRDFAEKSRTA
jgi:hypothetical protein